MASTDDMARVEVRFEADAAGGTAWAVRSARFVERLSTPYELTLELETDEKDADPIQLLGQPIKVVITRSGGERIIAGIVAELEEGAAARDQIEARLLVRPALEALRHRVDTRIFQDKSVPEILKEVLDDALAGFSRTFEDRTARTYPKCEYRVQYDESDLDFCHRLMEEEGIVYWFEHEGEAETLVLADDDGEYGTVETIHGGAIAIDPRSHDQSGKETIAVFDPRAAVRPTLLATRHYDWTHPSAPVEGASSDAAKGDQPHGAYVDPPREIYEQDHHPLTFSDYDGSAYGANDVDEQVRLRREAHVFSASTVDGRSSVTAMRTGATFEIAGHPNGELDRGWLVLAVTHEFDGGAGYENTFVCMPDDVPFRAPRTTPRPRIASALTALVVGPAGEEIHTDKHGRIRVQFHWDRDGKMDEKSTCWIRVMQPWAGAGWGFVFLPRLGMEVIVEFVGGDPDRPLVIGSLYDGERAVPYPLPGEKTKSTILTQSSLGGGGFNELRFEDLAGKEQIFIHAQKDFDEIVENDHTTTVHHDQKIRVDNDQSQEVGNNQTEHVFVNQDLTVDANRTITVHGDFVETVDGSETRTVTSGVTETIDGGETRTVTGGMTESISGGRTQTITGSSTESITGALSQSVTGGITITTPSTYTITAAGGFKLTTPAATTFIAPGGYTLLAPGGQTSIDESWFSLGNKWFDSYGMKATTVVTKIGINYVMNILMAAVSIDLAGAKLTTGGATEEFSGAKAETAGAKLRSLGGSLVFCGLFNKT